MDEQIIIPTEKPKQLFKEHFNNEKNHRIFFSGKFGVGKTTFLNDFFTEESTLFLRPINYQVANNEDIFEYIKYDLLFQLFQQKKIEINDDINSEILLYEYLKNDGLNLAYNSTINILSALPKIGIAFKAVKNITKFLKSFENYKHENKNSEKKIIEDFIDRIESQEGTFKEFDLISKIISETVSNNNFTLIIDDLDRLDPEHLFRILNIFSSHIDIESNQNKFGFKKIIFVGDIHNMESIYHHRYGDKSDSSGYFNKFYSQSIFNFENNTSIIKSLETILSDYAERYDLEKDKVSIIKYEVTTILIDLIKGGHLTLRRLLNGLNSYQLVGLDNHYIPVLKNQNLRLQTLNIIFVFQIIENLFGFEYSQLIKSIEKCKIFNPSTTTYELMIDELIIFNSDFEFDDGKNEEIYLDGMNILIESINIDTWPSQNKDIGIKLNFKDYEQKKKLVNNFYHHFLIGYNHYKDY